MNRALLIQGDCRDAMRALPDASVHCCVTDPPYELGFMGKAWDRRGVAFDPATWAGMLRVLRPGAHLLAFGGTRTYHRMTCAIEDAGFEIRDCLMWVYGSGFPKSKNLAGEWEGWGSALKPAVEPIVMARRPLSQTNLQTNADVWGAGALNIRAGRVETTEDTRRTCAGGFGSSFSDDGWQAPEGSINGGDPAGRWPANVIFDEEAAALLDEQSGELQSGANPTRRMADKFRDVYSAYSGQQECTPARGADAGGASRFFYVAKPDRDERDAGLAHLAHGTRNRVNPGGLEHDPKWAPVRAKNTHPTVKPVSLMKHLVRLVCAPGGTVLDPFCGSGTTGMAAVAEGFEFIGIEREAEYVTIAEGRIRDVAPLLVTTEIRVLEQSASEALA